MTHQEIAAKVFTTFSDELASLTPDIRGFVVDAFQQYCPDHFWEIPASTSGKYHPQIVLGEGGLVRHVKLAIWWGRELCKANPEPINENQVVAALLLHDIWKNGSTPLIIYYDHNKGKTVWPKGPPNITTTHGGLLADCLLENDTLDLRDIACAIGGHMGRWTDPRFECYTAKNLNNSAVRINLINTVHYADYCASRRLSEDQR